MRIFKNLFTIITLVMICTLCSCSKAADCMSVRLSPQDETLYELSTEIYDDYELKNIAEFSGTLQELNANYPIECIRKISAGYRASYCGEFNVTSIIFDASGQKIIGNVYQTSKEKIYFDDLSVGDSIEDVKEIDSAASYSFLYTGRNDTPKQSVHYTSDGYLITIEYDNNHLISDIKSELI